MYENTVCKDVTIDYEALSVIVITARVVKST